MWKPAVGETWRWHMDDDSYEDFRITSLNAAHKYGIDSTARGICDHWGEIDLWDVEFFTGPGCRWELVEDEFMRWVRETREEHGIQT